MNYPTVVQRAYAIKRDMNELNSGQAALKGVGTSQGHNNNKKRKWEASPGRNTTGIPPCDICGKKHKEPCCFGKGVCYLYGQAGHVWKDCP